MAETQVIETQIPSALTELENAKLEMAKARMEAVNAKLGNLQASYQLELRNLNDNGRAAEQYVRTVITEIAAAHPDLEFSQEAATFVPKPAKAIPAPTPAPVPEGSTTVQ